MSLSNAVLGGISFVNRGIQGLIANILLAPVLMTSVEKVSQIPPSASWLGVMGVNMLIAKSFKKPGGTYWHAGSIGYLTGSALMTALVTLGLSLR